MKEIEHGKHTRGVLDTSEGQKVGQGVSKAAFRVSMTVRIASALQGMREKTVQLIAKIPRWPTTNEDCHWLERENVVREQLRAGGVPVFPTFRLDPESRAVYTTDLTQNGRNFVVSALALSELPKDIPACPNAQEVLQGLLKICMDVMSCGLHFKNPDALYFIIDRQTGKTRVLVGDYKHVQEEKDASSALFWNRLATNAAVSHLNSVLQIPEAQIQESLGFNESR